MELRCHWCLVSFAEIPIAVAHPCGHNICISCHHIYQPHWCVVCQREVQRAATDCGIPETRTWNDHPHTPSHPSPQPHMSPFAIPSPQPLSTTHTNTTLPSTPQTHTSPETTFGLSAPNEDNHQNSIQGTDNSGDVNLMLYNTQQGEQNSETGKPGIARELKKKFESGAFMSPEGAAGWKNSEEHPRVAQNSFHISIQQETFGRGKDSLTPDTPPGIHPTALPSEGQTIPQRRKAHSRGQQLYLQGIATRDAYLTPSRAREPSPSPPKTRDTSPSSSRHTDPSCCSSKTREPSSPSKPRYHSPSPSKHRDPSPSSFGSKQLSPSPSGTRKSSPSPFRPAEPFALHFFGKDAKFSGTRSQGGSVEGATPRPTATQEPSQLKQPLTPIRTEDLTIPRTPRPIITTTTITPGRPDKEVVVKGGAGLPHHHLGNAPHTLSQPSSPTQNQGLRSEEEEEETFKERIAAEFFRLYGLSKELWTEFLTLNEMREHCERLEEERKRYLEEREQLRKEEKRLQSEQKQQKEKVGELQHEVTQLRERQRGQEEGMQQPMGKEHLKSLNENLLRQLETLKQENMKLEGELNCKEEGRERAVLTQMRGERDKYKEELGQLKGRESTRLPQMRRERDKYQEEVDELKGRDDSYIEKVNELNQRENNKISELQQERESLKLEVDHLKWRESTQITQMQRERDNHKEEVDELRRKEAALKNHMADVKRERDKYKETLDQLMAREAQVDQIIQMAIERENHKKREDTESSKIAELEQEIHNYKVKIEEHKRKETILENQVTQMKLEKESHIKNLDPQITQLKQDICYCREQVEEHKRRKATLENQMETEKENYQKEVATQIAQLEHERDNYREEGQELKRREATLQNQLKQMKIDKDRDKMEIDSCKKERENHKQEADQLKRRNSTLNSQLTQTRIERDRYKSERDICRSERDNDKRERDHCKRESNSHKEEVERLKQKHDTEITQLRQERDQHQSEAERLRREMEVASGAGEAGQREVMQLERDLADIPVPSAYIQLCPRGAAEGKEVVTLGLGEELVTQGLPNLRNSSYINSVVQCLYHLPALRNALASPRVYQHDQSGTGVALALARLFEAMRNDSDTMIRFAARDLKGVLGTHDASFRGKQQQEAHDLFSALVSWLQTDLSQHDVPDLPCHTSSMFNGLLETKITCLDSPTPLTHTSEAFTSLSLPVVGRNNLSLEDLLNKYFREQSLEWDCQHCHYTHECCHRTHIRSCPPVLVIHFSRVAEHRSTRKTKVNFPLTGLSLRRYMAPNAPPLPQYQLVSVVCHEGNMGSGRCIAYCRYGSGYEGNKWRMCSDERVNDVWERDMLDDGNAHLLFYIQQ